MSNAIENAEKVIKNNADKSHKDNILISECQYDVSQLYKDLLNTERENIKVLNRIEE